MITKKQMIKEMLELGFEEVPSTSSKYRSFRHPKHAFNYYVGKAGALRVGRCCTKSRSLTHAKEQVLRDWKANQ